MEEEMLCMRSIFLEEAKELITEAENAILSLKKRCDLENSLNKAFKVVHTLKGSARAVGYKDLSKVLHAAESILNSAFAPPIII